MSVTTHSHDRTDGGAQDELVTDFDALRGGARRRSRLVTFAKPAEPAAYEVGSVRNALMILSLLREFNCIGVSEAAQQLGLGLSTTHRLLRTMRAHGYVDQDERTHKYSLGPAMGVSTPARAFDDYAEVALDTLKWLSSTTKETVHLAVARQTNIDYLAAVQSPLRMSIASRDGGGVPAHATSIGKVLLASLPRATFSRLYPDEHIDGPTEFSCRTRLSLETELQVTRRIGYARNVDESEYHVSALAMAVREVGGIPAMAISVAVPRDRLRLSANPYRPSSSEIALLRMLTTAARRIEGALAG